MESPKYVWEVWNGLSFRQPHIKRYVLVKMNAKGGCTVLQRGSNHVIKPMAGKKFLTEWNEVLKYLAEWHRDQLERFRSSVEELEKSADEPQRGVTIEEVRSEPYPKFTNLKV